MHEPNSGESSLNTRGSSQSLRFSDKERRGKPAFNERTMGFEKATHTRGQKVAQVFHLPDSCALRRNLVQKKIFAIIT